MTRQTEPRSFKEFLTIGEAAELLGVHPDTLRNWDRAGKLPAMRHPVNGYRLYSLTSLRELVAQPLSSDPAKGASA